MGCDIHLYSETKKNDAWVADDADSFFDKKEEGEDYPEVGMNSPYGDRNYELFGLLSVGVRRVYAESFPQRGMPTDASEEVARLYEHWGGDAHSASYLTLAELKHKAAEMLITGSYVLPDLLYLLQAIPTPDAELENRRIVFWFDN